MKAIKVAYVLSFLYYLPSICPKMNQSMLLIEKKFFCNPNGIVSIIDPRHDTPKFWKNMLLRSQILKLELLTGDRDKIYD
jgi:protein SCO1/2